MKERLVEDDGNDEFQHETIGNTTNSLQSTEDTGLTSSAQHVEDTFIVSSVQPGIYSVRITTYM